MSTSQPSPAAPESNRVQGTTVGRYTLLTKLATGGMAEIFLARQLGPLNFEKLVVVKKILDTYAEDPDFVTMFLDEARIAAQLNHPNIVQIFDLGEDRGTYYIAMEYLAGESLSAVARAARKQDRPIPPAMAARLISMAAEALDYAHRKSDASGRPLGIVHRDISPQNLFVTYDGNLKVVDFGIAKAANRASHTQDGLVKGKLSYMSPEQARSKPVDGRSDVFALGVVLFELCTRSRLFAFDDPVQTFGAVVGPEPIPRPSERDPHIDPKLEGIVMKALEREPDRRYASANELHLALEGWLREVQPFTNSDLSDFMTALFADRIKDRAALVERASLGEDVSSKVGVIKRDDTDRSMPGKTDGRAPAATPVTTSHLALGVGLGLGILAAGAVVAWALRRPELPVAQTITVPPPVAPAPTAPAPTTLKIQTEPAHAQVTVDGVARGTAPVEISGLVPGPHAVRVQAADRQDLTRTVNLERPGQSLEVVISLPPAAVPAPAAPIAAPPVAALPEARIAERTGRRRMGKLTIETVPWTDVYLGSKLLGETPLVELPLPAGPVTLRLKNPEKKIDQTVELEVEPDRVTAKKLRF